MSTHVTMYLGDYHFPELHEKFIEIKKEHYVIGFFNLVVGYEPVCSWTGINLVLIVADGLDDGAHTALTPADARACVCVPECD